MKRKIKYFTSSLALLTSFMMPKAEAQLDPKMFKDLTHYFKPDMTHYSPVIGMAALESGLIHNLRFYGSLDEGHQLDQNGQPVEERLYSADKPHVFGEQKDAVFGLLHMLFRSPAGTLSPHTAGEGLTNFHSVASPEKVAMLLNYVQELIQLKEPFQTTIQDKKKAQAAEVVHYRGLTKKIENLKTKYKKDLMPAEEKKKTGLERDIGLILSAIEKSVSQELETDPDKKFLYPSHTTEQIILSYFCQKFNDQKDILDMMSHLNRNIIDEAHHQELEDRLKQNNPQDLLGPDDLEKIAQKPSYDIDDIYALSHAYLFDVQFTPYIENSALISNSNCQIYDRKNNVIIASSYADCGETTARHLINLMAYDAEHENFDLTHLKEHMKDKNNPYFENFLKFYEQQTTSQVNNGSIDMRTLWNRVMGDLNKAGDVTKIRYGKSQGDIEYELDPGIINLLHAFDKIFSLSLDSLTDTAKFEEKKFWIETSLSKLFKVFKPNQQIKFDSSNVQDDLKNHDVQGNLLITVQDENKKNLFTFDFFAQAGRHSDVKIIKNLDRLDSKQEEYRKKIVQYKKELEDTHKINTQGVQQDIWLLNGNGFFVQQYVEEPLYKILNQKLDDNDSKIIFITKLITSYKMSDLDLTALGKEQVKQITRNILKSLSWEDDNTFNQIKSILKPAPVAKSWNRNRKKTKVTKKNLPYEEIFAYDEIQRNLEPLKFKDLKDVDNQKMLSNLRYVHIKDDTLQKYSFSGTEFKKVKNIEIESPYLESLIFQKNSFNLLNLKKAQNLKEIEFKEDNLQLKLDLKGSGIRYPNQIKGIEHLDEDKITW
ncbi:MAG: hypothetical protein ACRYGR_03460 [Janthinobacterium lividum]